MSSFSNVPLLDLCLDPHLHQGLLHDERQRQSIASWLDRFHEITSPDHSDALQKILSDKGKTIHDAPFVISHQGINGFFLSAAPPIMLDTTTTTTTATDTDRVVVDVQLHDGNHRMLALAYFFGIERFAEFTIHDLEVNHVIKFFHTKPLTTQDLLALKQVDYNADELDNQIEYWYSAKPCENFINKWQGGARGSANRDDPGHYFASCYVHYLRSHVPINLRDYYGMQEKFTLRHALGILLQQSDILPRPLRLGLVEIPTKRGYELRGQFTRWMAAYPSIYCNPPNGKFLLPTGHSYEYKYYRPSDRTWYPDGGNLRVTPRDI
eukprot:scaffold9428_cov200-Ochromonas_danica.AAC.3